MNSGDLVNVYLEGVARLVRFYRRADSAGFEWWDVEFVGEESNGCFFRMVSIADKIEEVTNES